MNKNILTEKVTVTCAGIEIATFTVPVVVNAIPAGKFRAAIELKYPKRSIDKFLEFVHALREDGMGKIKVTAGKAGAKK